MNGKNELETIAMSLSAILLGLINIAIVIVVLILIGAVIVWFLGYLGWAPPPQVQKLYLAIVALIALYMLVALLFGIPSLRVIGRVGATGGFTLWT
jgi:Na+/H+-dicarboxylate symporter